MSARVRPSGSSASVMTPISSWVSVRSVWRTIGVCAQPTTAMSLLVWDVGAPSEDPVHEVGVVDVGLAVGHPAEQAARGPAGAAHRLALRAGGAHTASTRTPTRTSSTGSSMHRLIAEHHVEAVEEHEHPGEGLGLGLARVLHGRHDHEVGDRARVREIDLGLGPNSIESIGQYGRSPPT